MLPLDSFNQSDLLLRRSSGLVPKAAAGSEHCACLREAMLTHVPSFAAVAVSVWNEFVSSSCSLACIHICCMQGGTNHSSMPLKMKMSSRHSFAKDLAENHFCHSWFFLDLLQFVSRFPYPFSKVYWNPTSRVSYGESQL